MRFLRRVLGVARLDTKTFEEVRDNPNSSNEALLLLGLFSAAGALFVVITTGIARVSVCLFFFWLQFLGWFIQVWIILQVGRLIVRTEKCPTYEELFRTASFSVVPTILMAWTMLLPRPFFEIGSFIAATWFLVAFVMALRTAFR